MIIIMCNTQIKYNQCLQHPAFWSKSATNSQKGPCLAYPIVCLWWGCLQWPQGQQRLWKWGGWIWDALWRLEHTDRPALGVGATRQGRSHPQPKGC